MTQTISNFALPNYDMEGCYFIPPLAYDHFSRAENNLPITAKVFHFTMGLLELIPIIGTVIAYIESFFFYMFFASDTELEYSRFFDRLTEDYGPIKSFIELKLRTAITTSNIDGFKRWIDNFHSAGHITSAQRDDLMRSAEQIVLVE